MSNKKICFVSIDVEQDFRETERKFFGVENLDKILDIFKKYNISATLFVTGEVLERYTDLAKDWQKDYEIACHSFTHRFWNTLGQAEKKKELEDFISLYQKIFYQKPKGFRAPSHIIDEEGLKLLEEKGFLYDSSVVPHYPPFKKYRGYTKKAPLSPYWIWIDSRFLEIPVSGLIFGIPLVGTWISKLPLIIYQLLTINSPDFLTFNLHSWDSLNIELLEKIDKILKILKKKNYQFLNGEQIYQNRK